MKILFILIISFIFASDLFINSGVPASFDQNTHLANIAAFYKATRQGEIPARWADGFGNYGMPIPIIAQQVTSYLGAIVNFFTDNIYVSYNIVVFIGAFLSSLFFYYFIRLYFRPETALAATFLFNFAPYRILNIYIRGAVPEFFSAVFLPIVLIGTYRLLEQKKLSGAIIIALGIAGIILSHPFMLVVYALIYVPYTFFLVLKQKVKLRPMVWLAMSYIVGIGLTAYYMVPLVIEIKYFYYGLAKTHFTPNYYLNLENYFNPNWYYYYLNDTYVRGHFIQVGLLEVMLIITFAVYFVVMLLKKRTFDNPLMWTISIAGILSVFLTTSYSEVLYKNISLLDSIQRPWRMLSAFIFLPPIALAFMLDKVHKKFYLITTIIIIIGVMFLRFPQIYGKNYFSVPQSNYYFTIENLHGTILNTIWTSDTKDYPVKKFKGEVIEGEGRILESKIRNATRQYKVKADTDIRMVDYTFYFPGWKAYVDGTPTEIQFQDPEYRGVITYTVPKGEHVVSLKFEDTKVRLVGNLVSLASVMIVIVALIHLRKKKLLN